MKLISQIAELEKHIEHHCEINLKVSSAPVGWHIEHSLMVVSGITYHILKSNPKDYKWQFSLSKTIIFLTRKIPRGKSKAPSLVDPKNYTLDAIQDFLIKAKASPEKYLAMDKDQFFLHPYFGNLKSKDALKLLEIHTEHHLGIIQDILMKNLCVL
jgi:hypothetical protein